MQPIHIIGGVLVALLLVDYFRGGVAAAGLGDNGGNGDEATTGSLLTFRRPVLYTATPSAPGTPPILTNPRPAGPPAPLPPVAPPSTPGPVAAPTTAPNPIQLPGYTPGTYTNPGWALPDTPPASGPTPIPVADTPAPTDVPTYEPPEPPEHNYV